ncbi:MAG: arsenate reductase (glutaredoxin) [Bacteroidetes bacterium]|nr:arsenate reductase (glutaredoxin) [Bacteroidota bacterium]
MKIYHNPNCTKSREGLKYLKEKTVDYQVINYMKNGLTEEDLKEILLKLNQKPEDIIRTKEAIYKSDFKDKKFTDDEWIKIIIEHPKLLQRPIVVDKTKAVFAQPPEEIDKLIP